MFSVVSRVIYSGAAAYCRWSSPRKSRSAKPPRSINPRVSTSEVRHSQRPIRPSGESRFRPQPRCIGGKGPRTARKGPSQWAEANGHACQNTNADKPPALRPERLHRAAPRAAPRAGKGLLRPAGDFRGPKARPRSRAPGGKALRGCRARLHLIAGECRSRESTRTGMDRAGR